MIIKQPARDEDEEDSEEEVTQTASSVGGTNDLVTERGVHEVSCCRRKEPPMQRD